MAKNNVCPYCGATLEKTATHCSHCLHEIEVVANKRHEDTIKGLRKDRKAMKKTLPKKIVAFFSYKIAIIITALIAIILVGVLVAFISAKLHNASAGNTEEKWLKTLEEYYTNEQYKELTEYVDENYIYGYKFEKYTQVADAYYYYMKLVEEWDYYGEMGPKLNSDSRVRIMCWVLYYGVCGMHAAENGYTDKGLLGNETLLKEIYADIETFMLERLPITKEEISEMLALESFNEEDLYPYSDAVVTGLGDI